MYNKSMHNIVRQINEKEQKMPSKRYTRDNIKEQMKLAPHTFVIFDIDISDYCRKRGLKDAKGSSYYERIFYIDSHSTGGTMGLINDDETCPTIHVDLGEMLEKVERYKKEDPEMYKLMADSCAELGWEKPVEEVIRVAIECEKKAIQAGLAKPQEI